MYPDTTFFKQYIVYLSLLVLTFFAAFFPVISDLIYTWSSSENYSHGFFIVPIVIFLIWEKRDNFISASYERSGMWIFVFVLTLIVYIISYLASIKTLSYVAMIFSIWSLVIYVFGIKIFKILLFPLFFLLFMVPVPGQIYSAMTVPLQLIVTKASVYAAEWLNIPLYREGNVIHLPEQTLAVVEACSGMRSLMTLLTLSALFGYFVLRSKSMRVVLLAASLPVALFVNILRIFFMIFSLYYLHIDLTAGTLHTVYGVVIFFFGIIMIFLVGRALGWLETAFVQE